MHSYRQNDFCVCAPDSRGKPYRQTLGSNYLQNAALHTAHSYTRLIISISETEMARVRGFLDCSLTVKSVLLLLLLVTSELVQDTHAEDTVFLVNNTALGTAGGKRFDTDLGNAAMQTVLKTAKSFIQTQFSLGPQKQITQLTLFVDDSVGIAYATAGAIPLHQEIHLSASYVEQYMPGDKAALTFQITGILYHESTHGWQNNNGSYGSDSHFHGTIEGMADYIRLRAGFADKSWSKQGGGNWYDGYSTTAYFFDWIDTTQFKGFADQLNQKMATPWSDSFFQDITRKTVDQLWLSYQSTGFK